MIVRTRTPEELSTFTLCRHTGPVWQIAWAHPKFGHIIASCSYDGKVIIWKEQTGQTGAGSWLKINEHTLHAASGSSRPCLILPFEQRIEP